MSYNYYFFHHIAKEELRRSNSKIYLFYCFTMYNSCFKFQYDSGLLTVKSIVVQHGILLKYYIYIHMIFYHILFTSPEISI